MVPGNLLNKFPMNKGAGRGAQGGGGVFVRTIQWKSSLESE